MAHNTPRLGLQQPDASDNESAFPAVDQQAMGILDNAAIFLSGTLVGRPAPSIAGRYYLATDDTSSGSSIGTLYFDTGSAWVAGFNPPSRGATNISTSQSTSSASYATLATPDQVAGLVLPTNGLFRVRYQATWQESVAGAARAAIFIGSNQAQIAVGSTGTVQPRGQAAVTNASGTGINQNQILSSFYAGLLSAGRSSGASGYTGDVTTGQIIGAACDTSNGYVAFEHLNDIIVTSTGAIYGGACEIEAAAGTYTVSVQFKTSSGTVTASNRKLWVEAISFS